MRGWWYYTLLSVNDNDDGNQGCHSYSIPNA